MPDVLASSRDEIICRKDVRTVVSSAAARLRAVGRGGGTTSSATWGLQRSLRCSDEAACSYNDSEEAAGLSACPAARERSVRAACGRRLHGHTLGE